MSIMEEIRELPRNEKLIVMESIWADLASNEKFDSPDWHREELVKTKTRLENGVEKILDWSSAKRSLRKEFE